jgi:serine/threonine protein kinase
MDLLCCFSSLSFDFRFYLRDCCSGEMFDFIVAQKHVAEIQACKFFHQIIDAVDCLHKNEITHRDLKPEVSLLLFNAFLKKSFLRDVFLQLTTLCVCVCVCLSI